MCVCVVLPCAATKLLPTRRMRPHMRRRPVVSSPNCLVANVHRECAPWCRRMQKSWAEGGMPVMERRWKGYEARHWKWHGRQQHCLWANTYRHHIDVITRRCSSVYTTVTFFGGTSFGVCWSLVHLHGHLLGFWSLGLKELIFWPSVCSLQGYFCASSHGCRATRDSMGVLDSTSGPFLAAGISRSSLYIYISLLIFMNYDLYLFLIYWTVFASTWYLDSQLLVLRGCLLCWAARPFAILTESMVKIGLFAE